MAAAGAGAAGSTRATTATTPRPYQVRLIKAVEASRSGAIVVLPTGAGKTLVAAVLAKRTVDAGRRVLFLVPTNALLQQQAKYLTHETGIPVTPKKRGVSVSDDIVIATPGAYLNAVEGEYHHPRVQVSAFGLIVFDEVHHAAKDHPYAKVAALVVHARKRSDGDGTSVAVPKVLGLSATLTYELERARMIADITRLLTETLGVGTTGVMTASNDELAADGFETAHREPTGLAPQDIRDVGGVGLGKYPCDPSSLREDFLAAVEEQTCHPLSQELVKGVRMLEGKLPPELVAKGVYDGLYNDTGLNAHELSACAAELAKALQASPDAFEDRDDSDAAALRHATVLQNTVATLTELEHLLEALHLAYVSQERDLEMSYVYLDMVVERGLVPPATVDAESPPAPASAALATVEGSVVELVRQRRDAYLAAHPGAFTRTLTLREALVSAFAEKERAGTSRLRCIVQVQQKLMVHITDYFLTKDAAITLCHLRPTKLHAYSTTGKMASPSFRMTPSEAKESLAAFNEGRADVLVTTSVAEEGIDVKAANHTIRFDPPQTVVSHKQSVGRGRADDATFRVIAEYPKKRVSHLEAAYAMHNDIVQRMSRGETLTAE